MQFDPLAVVCIVLQFLRFQRRFSGAGRDRAFREGEGIKRGAIGAGLRGNQGDGGLCRLAVSGTPGAPAAPAEGECRPSSLTSRILSLCLGNCFSSCFMSLMALKQAEQKQKQQAYP